MRVTELNRDELTELKQHYYTEKMDELGQGVSYGEYAQIDELVTDEEIFKEYEDTDFVKDDFFCNCR